MSTSPELENRLMELEIKVGLAEDLVDQLNQTLYRQQQQIDLLLREVADLRRQLSDGATGSRANDRPPHY